jgi:hypothetical protein
MSSLFIANTSNKHNEFTFRLPGNDQLRRVIISAGTQQQVLNNAQKEEVDAVISQHAPYGLVEASQVHKIDKFSGVLYSIDKPVTVNAMNLAIEKNNDILLEEGYNLRQIAAVATNASLDETLSHTRGLGKQKSIELEVAEIPEEHTTKRKMLNQKIKVTKD